MTPTAPTAPLPRGRSDVPGMWLTTVLRPAGAMTAGDGARFAAALRAASDSSGVVLVDLRAAGPLPRAVRRALADADARLAGSGGALLVVDGDAPATGVPSGPPSVHLLDPGDAAEAGTARRTPAPSARRRGCVASPA